MDLTSTKGDLSDSRRSGVVTQTPKVGGAFGLDLSKLDDIDEAED